MEGPFLYLSLYFKQHRADYYEALQQNVIVSIKRVAESAGIAVPTATRAMKRLQELGIAKELTGGNYGKLFAYER